MEEIKIYTEADIPTIANIRNDDPYDIYIGRVNKWRDLPHSKWHNPFPLKRESERPECLIKHMNYLLSNQELLDSLWELSGKVMGCWCFTTIDKATGRGIGKVCHGHNLIKMYKKIVLGIEE